MISRKTFHLDFFFSYCSNQNRSHLYFVQCFTIIIVWLWNIIFYLCFGELFGSTLSPTCHRVQIFLVERIGESLAAPNWEVFYFYIKWQLRYFTRELNTLKEISTSVKMILKGSHPSVFRRKQIVNFEDRQTDRQGSGFEEIPKGTKRSVYVICKAGQFFR